MHILGIRHHGPGSARRVKEYLETAAPDLILVEGPPDFTELIPHVAAPGMEPPVALLAYHPDEPARALFYPFATFSPEWQAMRYGLAHRVPVRFMDLPLAHRFAQQMEQEAEAQKKREAEMAAQGEEGENLASAVEQPTENAAPEQGAEFPQPPYPDDPIGQLAQAAGYPDGDEWWERLFEQSLEQGQSGFEAVMLAMQTLREAYPLHRHDEDLPREAYMRKVIRQGQDEGFKNIAIVCGAWHGPALRDLSTKKADEALLKKLPKAKVAATWIPWTYDRLALRSGYGAGIASPGWYHHLWHQPHDDGTRWLAQVAGIFRKNQVDVSPAHVIEAVRLAQSLAGLREHPRPGLPELNEATQTVICMGEAEKMTLIHDELIVSDRLGSVPPGVPQVPLLADLETCQKRLKLKVTTGVETLVLDLRKPNDLERSILFHRLDLLGIGWAQAQNTSGKGTYKEAWELRWQPELAVQVIEMGIWGNTLSEAAAQFANHLAEGAQDIRQMARLLERVLPADLPKAVNQVMQRLDQAAALSTDLVQMMQAAGSLVQVYRYGDVRQTDTSLVKNILDGLLARIFVGLPNACYSLNEDAANEMLDSLAATDGAIGILALDDVRAAWHHTLHHLLSGGSALINGYATRLLYDARALAQSEAEQHFYVALSPAQPPAQTAGWLEGFLRGSGTVLLLDENLWQLIDHWVTGLDPDVFMQLLPLLRRTFANFSATERRKIGEKALASQGGSLSGKLPAQAADFDHDRAVSALPVLWQILGYQPANQ
ncbi:MAG: DUF5682 family protein [Bernardetiaceae bacterium]|jgi:hypothetical protein|nr:DUF5682 family protein [Bernardetiaceae bacterium]